VYEADPTVAIELSDVALLKLRLPPGKKLKAIRFARDEDLLLGETVLALGNPFGLGGSVTRGILSSKNRRPAVEDVPLDYQDWLQTDAAINPGNSGGPLINLEGELIGLNVAVYREGQGIGFAIPVKKVAEALSQFFTPEVSSGMWFGGRVRQTDEGLTVALVQPRSPAAEAGLREGQRIVEVNGKVPRTLIEFNELLCAQPEHRPRLTLRDASGPREVRVSLVPFEELLSRKLGLGIMFLGAGEQVRYPIPGRPGLYVTAVERGGPAEQAGLRAGMLLAAVGDQEARDLLTVATVVSATAPGDRLTLTVVEPQRLGSGFVRYLQRGTTVEVR
jgi:S1-C subfamily serine protease